MPPANMPWHVRELNAEGPDGHRFHMASEATGRFPELKQFGT
jgi:hypothetical protein